MLVPQGPATEDGFFLRVLRGVIRSTFMKLTDLFLAQLEGDGPSADDARFA